MRRGRQPRPRDRHQELIVPAEGRWLLYTDGASRGNPGPAAIGAVLFDRNGRRVHAVSQVIGEATNNVAEYSAAIAGLEAALSLGIRDIELRMDSELVVRQISGQYRVRHPKLKPLWARLNELSAGFASFEARAVPRAQNKVADGLANQALDKTML